MKNLIFLISALFIYVNSFSQDTIFMMNKEILCGKVELVSTTEIKYRNIKNPTGPVYTIDSKNISHVKYSNGSIDTISLNNKFVPEVTLVKAVPPTISQTSKMVINGKGIIVHNNQILNDNEIRAKIMEYPFPKNKKLMMREYQQLRKYKSNQIIAECVGWGVGFGVPVVVTYITLVESTNSYNSSGLDPTSIIIAGALTGALIRTVGQVIKHVNKNKKLHQREVIANLYNEMQ